MITNYTQPIDNEQLMKLIGEKKWDEAFEVLAQPLHAWLYEEQDFDKLLSRNPIEQIILAFDYVNAQVGQGGFIQLIQNGYISLLVMIIENLQAIKIETKMTGILDEVLKVFVLNKDDLLRETSVEEFGRMYKEYGEFTILEQRYNEELEVFLRLIVNEVVKQDNSIK